MRSLLRRLQPPAAPAGPAPFISVVVPSFNQGEFVADCLRSIATQTGATSEILFMDGGSTDATLAMVKPFHAQLAHFQSGPDGGQSDAINQGLRRARGELVTWLNSDDFLEPDAFTHLREACAREPAAPFYLGLGWRTDRAGTARIPFYPEGFGYRREALVWGLNFILQPSTFMRRSALAAVGGQLDPSLHYAMDTDLWLRLAAVGDPALVPHPLACSREYGETKTATGAWARFAEIQRVAARYAGGATLTPGVLAELCRVLHETIQNGEEVRAHLPSDAHTRVMELWAAAAAGLRGVCGRDDGLPVTAV